MPTYSQNAGDASAYVTAWRPLAYHVSQLLYSYLERNQLAYSPYLSYYVTSTAFRKFIYPFAQGSTRFNLCKADFEKASIKLPSLDNQKRISAMLDCIAEKIQAEKAILEYYNIQRQYLLRQMFI